MPASLYHSRAMEDELTFDYRTAGESHGPELSAIVEGTPAGLELLEESLNADLARRQLGYGRGGRMKIETDTASITAGVRHGRTLGSPIALKIANADWRNWQEKMAIGSLGHDAAPPATVPRPGHADLAGMQKYGHRDVRNVLERASARETAARVAVGAVARRLLAEFGISIFSHVVRIGEVEAGAAGTLTPASFAGVDESPVRCLDAAAATAMCEGIDRARESGESLGGIFEVLAFGLPPGLGSHVSGPSRLGGRIGGALMSIPAIKGAEIGDGFALAGVPGSAAHDEIFYDPRREYHRQTNHAGGLEGGMTNGEPVVARACMKPIPTLTKPLRSVDMSTGAEAPAMKERSDVCAVPAAAVVGEAMLAIELVRALIGKFGGDSVRDMRTSMDSYRERLREDWRPA